jgi:superfamily II DNA/RNA helicase
MPRTIEEIEAFIDEVTVAGFRGRLIARGQARAMIWSNGVLPPGAPAFSDRLSYDLQSYGYSLLNLGLRLREMEGNPTKARLAFNQAATALESVTAKGELEDENRSFHCLMTAASYHLAHLSARAYSLLSNIQGNEHFSIIQRALAMLILREFGQLQNVIIDFRMSGIGSDERLTSEIQEQIDREEIGDEAGLASDGFLIDKVDAVLTDNFFASLSLYLLAIERGESALVDKAIFILNEGQEVSSELNLLPQWWIHRIAIHLISDLWDVTFHEKLPLLPAGGEADDWPALRELFIASHFKREKAEIDLWPSQLEAAGRAVDQSDDLVVSLPTSAGKTRIAELCILRCLAGGKRVVFITPLRALSAQTEATLQKSFGPLGMKVSALYGSIGVNHFDEDTLSESDIVVTTPEKLDFALRNEPDLLNDVGLLVFDEGHMIGLNEREVRYEVQIQRLLKRGDAAQRRIVCLSAILPDGDQLDDFTCWLRRDQPGELVKSVWRPTRLRFGEVRWSGQSARLDIRVGEERPFVPNFITGFVPPDHVPPKRLRTRLFPNSQQELSLATAWRLIEEGQTVLIFCPERRSVEPFADVILDLHERGALPSLLDGDVERLNTALALGEEWLGPDHPILQCLRLGVAFHHGALPAAFRKEVETLLRKGILKVTISSPTLAQGLNLSATSVIMHSLYRNGSPIQSSEFKNVIGRAGRAFVDVEGLILCPFIVQKNNKTRIWNSLISDSGARSMESGLVLLVLTLLKRMVSQTNGSFEQMMEYVLNNTEAWSFPNIQNEPPGDREQAQADWNRYLALFDTAMLSLVGDNDISEDEIPAILDEILQSSLWNRRLLRQEENIQTLLQAALVSRTKHIWRESTAPQRKGYYLAGVGLNSGQALDVIANDVNLLLVQANGAILNGDHENAITTITTIAEYVFPISPFSPQVKPDNWREVLRQWLLGLPLTAVSEGQESETLQFVEQGLVYHLPWAMEALRVRGIANGDVIDDLGSTLDEFELGLAVPAIETGTLNRSATLLIRAGFNSRLAAIKAVSDTAASFTTGHQLQQWLTSDVVEALGAVPNWPTAETKSLWLDFIRSSKRDEQSSWDTRRYWSPVEWDENPLPSGTPVRISMINNSSTVLSGESTPVGKIRSQLNPQHSGLIRASVSAIDVDRIDITYLGPDDLWVA